jgi:ParB-like nuclease domain
VVGTRSIENRPNSESLRGLCDQLQFTARDITQIARGDGIGLRRNTQFDQVSETQHIFRLCKQCRAEHGLVWLLHTSARHGVLQPIVVHPANGDGHHQFHFGAKRFRAAMRAGLVEVPVVIRAASADPYTEVAENQKAMA